MPIAEVSVPDGETYLFEFDVAAPPGWITYAYSGSSSVTDPPAEATFDCNWLMKDLVGDTLMTEDTAAADVGLYVFPDAAPGYWARTHIEQLNRRLPRVVGGYPDGNYHGDWQVTRGQMAVFVSQAALYGDDPPDEATFPDVPVDYWCFTEVERCVANGVVSGFDDGLYRPGMDVSRDQMAVYMVNASGIPTEAAADTFPDVPDDYWAVGEIEACVNNEIVRGYPDGLYKPTRLTDRAEMAIFVYRTLMRPTSNVVLVGGPGITEAVISAEGVFYPGDLAYYGWSEADEVDGGEYCYIALDGKHLASGTVTFTTWAADADRDADPEEDTQDFTVNGATAASDVETSGGIPYVVVAYEIPGGLDADTEYAVAIDLQNGESLEISFTTPE